LPMAAAVKANYTAAEADEEKSVDVSRKYK
jgi:hypothetical protein